MFRFPTAAAAKQKWPRASQWPPTGGNVRRRRFWAAAVFSFFDLVLFHLFFSLPHPLVRVLHRLVTGCFSFFFVRPTLKSPPGGTCLPQKCKNRFHTFLWWMFHYLRCTDDFHMKFHLKLSHSTRSTFWRQTAKNGVVAAGEIPSNVELADAILEIQSNNVLSKFNNIQFVILNYTSDDLCRNCRNSVEIWRKNVQVTWPSKRILIGSWPFSSKFHTLLQLPATWMVTHNVHHSIQVRTCWFRMKNIKFCQEKTATWSSHVTRFTTNEIFRRFSS